MPKFKIIIPIHIELNDHYVDNDRPLSIWVEADTAAEAIDCVGESIQHLVRKDTEKLHNQV